MHILKLHVQATVGLKLIRVSKEFRNWETSAYLLFPSSRSSAQAIPKPGDEKNVLRTCNDSSRTVSATTQFEIAASFDYATF